MNTLPKLRPSPIAGQWYSANAQRLGAQVDDYIAAAVLPDLPGEVLALVAPHAGHRYSGRTAGYAYRAVQGRHFDLVVMLSPLHQYNPAVFVTTAHQGYVTPLGEIAVDQNAVVEVDAALRADGAPGLTAVPYDDEHAVEIQLPFLQRALSGDFRLLPVMIRSQNPADARALARALTAVLPRYNALLVASTDLSHFFPEPVANQLDSEMMKQIEALSAEGVFHAERSKRGLACGFAAVGAVIETAQALGATRAVLLHHSTSADETGDRSQVVGYGAAAILKPA